ncbi:MAG: tRNA (N6-isopentenyl adenosine(37)-C2)-methylthiotransferase MiaB [Alphaproteobacteria bacterium]|nr:tRNA (N6-isopentenyl adenosine(37)-C2)-methylthiotransferase MiaB [Alphaproteobacteria bacterium]
MNKTVHIKTYGCQMNVYDSSRMRDVLAPLGYAETDMAEGADLVILNTCHIREKAAEKVYSELGKLREMKEARAAQGKEMLIAVAGCVGQAEGQEITRRNKAVDLVFGPQTYHRLPELLGQRQATGRAAVETEFAAERKFEELVEKPQAQGSVAAFLTIQEGCDKFCTFCVVPYTRGAEFSRPVAQILQEAAKLAARGVREVTLLGQNVNAYRGEGGNGPESLARLVARLSQIQGIERIRYVTSHPRDMTDDLIAAHGANEKLMPYLHLPIQAGNDRILKAMNRGHTVADYLRLVDKVKAARPDIALSGDFIVGFPGESEAEFAGTLQVAREVGYASAYTFKYSPRPGTPAAARADQIEEPVKDQRLAALQAQILEQTKAFNASCVGRELPVLLEKPGRHDGQLIGRSPYLQSVHVAAQNLSIGQIANISIKSVGPNSLSGQYVGQI